MFFPKKHVFLLDGCQAFPESGFSIRLKEEWVDSKTYVRDSGSKFQYKGLKAIWTYIHTHVEFFFYFLYFDYIRSVTVRKKFWTSIILRYNFLKYLIV